MESIDDHRIDYNRVGGSKRPAAHTQQKLTQVPPGLDGFLYVHGAGWGGGVEDQPITSTALTDGFSDDSFPVSLCSSFSRVI